MFRTLSIAALALVGSTTLASASAVFRLAAVTFDQGRATVMGTGGAMADTSGFFPIVTTKIDAVLPNASSIITSLKLGGAVTFAEGSDSITLSNLVVDANNNLIVADTSIDMGGTVTAASAVPLFSFTTSIFGQTLSSATGPNFDFKFTSAGASDFNAGLGLTGGNVAVAGSFGGVLNLVPEPAAFGVLGLGLTLAVAARRRRVA